MEEKIQEYVTGQKGTLGIDCSGLVYYVLNEATNGAVKTYFEETLDNEHLEYKDGILATNLANAAYGTKITQAKNIKPGCTIRTSNGGHVLVVHSVNKNAAGEVTSIVYAHSNDDEGPHHGYITIGDETKDLDDASQTWSDMAYSNPNYLQTIYNYTVLLEPVQEFV